MRRQKCSRHPWSSASERSRLRRLLSERDASALATLVRARARTVRLDGVARAGVYVVRDGNVVPAGATLAHRWTDLVVDGITEVYATASATQAVVDRLSLWPDPRGPIVVHTVPDTLGELLVDRAEMPAPVVAIDLLESSDPRSQRAGENVWAQTLKQWRAESAHGSIAHE